METQGLGWKTGLFVLVGLILLGALMLQFQKGSHFFEQTKTIKLKTESVGLIQSGASVLMAGVPIGNVRDIELEENGRSVTLILEIKAQYNIPKESTFVIEQIGLLGDQFVSVIPPKKKTAALKAGPQEETYLKSGDVVEGKEPFSFQDMARSTDVLIERVDETVAQLQETFKRIDTHLLKEETLSNLSMTIANLRHVAGQVDGAATEFRGLLRSNAPAFRATMTNTLTFSKKLTRAAGMLQGLLSTNRHKVHEVLSNLQKFSRNASDLSQGLKDGEGAAGMLLRDPQTQGHIASLIENTTLLTSNLNKYGIFYKPGVGRRDRTAYPGKTPFD